jgi:hypothetical protein
MSQDENADRAVVADTHTSFPPSEKDSCQQPHSSRASGRWLIAASLALPLLYVMGIPFVFVFNQWTGLIPEAVFAMYCAPLEYSLDKLPVLERIYRDYMFLVFRLLGHDILFWGR